MDVVGGVVIAALSYYLVPIVLHLHP
jgi:hypothetical protein